MAMEWTDDLATGLGDIDKQHKEIFNRVGRLAAACGEGRGKDEVMGLLLFLKDYVKEHFAAEEKLQVRHAYPDYPAHREQHNRFISEVGRLEAAFREEGATLGLVIMTNKTLTSWLVQHIGKLDRELADYLRGQGS